MNKDPETNVYIFPGELDTVGLEMKRQFMNDLLVKYGDFDDPLYVHAMLKAHTFDGKIKHMLYIMNKHLDRKAGIHPSVLHWELSKLYCDSGMFKKAQRCVAKALGLCSEKQQPKLYREIECYSPLCKNTMKDAGKAWKRVCKKYPKDKLLLYTSMINTIQLYIAHKSDKIQAYIVDAYDHILADDYDSEECDDIAIGVFRLYAKFSLIDVEHTLEIYNNTFLLVRKRGFRDLVPTILESAPVILENRQILLERNFSSILWALRCSKIKLTPDETTLVNCTRNRAKTCCYHCRQMFDKTWLCRECLSARYCSRKCQLLGYKNHKESCHAIKNSG